MSNSHPDYSKIIFELEDLLQNEYSVYARACFAMASAGKNIDGKFVKNTCNIGDTIIIEEPCDIHDVDQVQYVLTRQSIETINLYKEDYPEYYADEDYNVTGDVDYDEDDSETLVLEGAKTI